MKKVDAIVVSVQHDIFRNLGYDWFDQYFMDSNKVLFDLKGIYNRKEFEEKGYYYWRL